MASATLGEGDPYLAKICNCATKLGMGLRVLRLKKDIRAWGRYRIIILFN